MSETRKLAAILVSDVVGYSRLAGADEDRILARLRTLRSDLIDPTIAVHHGRIVKRTGDGSIIEFRSVVDAVNCAIELQRAMVERNAEVAPDKRIEFRIGIHLGDVVEESDGDLMGDGVNIAARLQGVAKPGAISLSEQAYWQVKGRLDLKVSDLGLTPLKNIAEPIRVYSLEVGQLTQAKATAAARAAIKPGSAVTAARASGLFLRWPMLVAALVLALLAAGAYAWHAGYAPRLPGASVAEDKLKTAPRLSLVVLPFENLGGDPEQQYLPMGSPTILRLIFLTFPIASLSPATPRLHSKAGKSTRKRSGANSACATCSKAACDARAKRSRSIRSSSRLRPARICGPIDSRAKEATSASCNSKSSHA
jgi:adenylate cyclase